MDLKPIDDLLEPQLAATLAGLSLTAAAFVSSQTANLRSAMGAAEDHVPEAIPAFDAKYRFFRGKQTLLIYAMFAFIVALVYSLSVDPAIDMKELTSWETGTELLFSAAPMALGLTFLTRGAYNLLPRQPKAR